MLEKALRVLPYGASTYSRSHVAFGRDVPLYIAHGDAWRCTDIDGNDYVDLVMGLGSLILGHRHPEVDEAIRRQLGNGTTSSRGSPLEIEAAERLLAHFPADHLVQWATNGTDATTGAIRLARAVTGNSRIIMAHDGYHGFADWALAGSTRGHGIPLSGDILRIDNLSDLNDPSKIDGVAAVIVEPDLHPEWIESLESWTRDRGAFLIVDELMCWQRYPEWTATATTHAGRPPDLYCLGKTLGNGMPVSAIVGHSDLMRRFAPGDQPNAFFSSTWAGHPLSMAAIIATLNVMEREDGCRRVWQTANAVHDKVSALLRDHRIDIAVGPPPFCRLTFRSQSLGRRFRELMAQNGVLIYASHNVSLAHDVNAMGKLFEAWQRVVEQLESETVADIAEPEGMMRR